MFKISSAFIASIILTINISSANAQNVFTTSNNSKTSATSDTTANTINSNTQDSLEKNQPTETSTEKKTTAPEKILTHKIYGKDKGVKNSEVKTELKNQFGDNAGCNNLINNCKRIGFSDSDLLKDCLYPILEGKSVKPKDLNAAFSINDDDVQSCKKSAYPSSISSDDDNAVKSNNTPSFNLKNNKPTTRKFQSKRYQNTESTATTDSSAPVTTDNDNSKNNQR